MPIEFAFLGILVSALLILGVTAFFARRHRTIMGSGAKARADTGNSATRQAASPT